MNRRKLLALLTVLVMVIAACGDGSETESTDTTEGTATTQASDGGAAQVDGEKLTVVATTTIWGDIVSNVTGDNADVEVLLPIGADPHDYQLSAAQAATMQEADLVVVNGLALEEGLLDVIESLEADGANILELADLLDPIEFGEGGHDHGDEEGHKDEEGDHDHGDEEGDHDHGDEEGHDDDHSVVAHACGHFDDEPIAVGTDGAIPDDHTRYAIELADGSASVTLDWDETSELSFFLGADAPISLIDEAGNELAAEATEAVGEECEPMALVASFDLEPGTYTVEIGPFDGADTIDLVWEETGHHGDDEGHKDEDGDDHEDEGEHHDEEGDHDHGDEEGDHDHDHGSHDPHVWMDPLRVADAVELIAEELVNLDSSVDWMANATAYADELRALDAEVVSMLDAVPEDRRKLVTNHDAFGYFAERYDFEVVGTVIPSGTTLADPSSAELAELVDVLVDENINVIFTETIEPAALAEAVAAEVDDVAVIELFTGSLGGPDSGAETYIDYVRTNASRITDALS